MVASRNRYRALLTGHVEGGDMKLHRVAVFVFCLLPAFVFADAYESFESKTLTFVAIGSNPGATFNDTLSCPLGLTLTSYSFSYIFRNDLGLRDRHVEERVVVKE